MVESEKIYRFAFEDLGQKPFSNFTEMLKAMPGFVRFRADRTIYDYVAKFMKDERLRIAFSFHPLFIGGNPFRVTGLYALVAHLERRFGVHFALGGTGSLIKGMVKLVEGQGGRRSSTPRSGTSSSRTARRQALNLASGETIPAAIVISNADAPFTYQSLLPKAQKRWTDRKVEAIDYSMSLFVWYFGTKRRYEAVDHHTIVLGPRYRGLLDDIFRHKKTRRGFQPLYPSTDRDRSVARARWL